MKTVQYLFSSRTVPYIAISRGNVAQIQEDNKSKRMGWGGLDETRERNRKVQG